MEKNLEELYCEMIKMCGAIIDDLARRHKKDEHTIDKLVEANNEYMRSNDYLMAQNEELKEKNGQLEFDFDRGWVAGEEAERQKNDN